MQLGFVSAILGELSLEEVLAFAADEGFGCVELMCWPPGKAERRYAGVCHIDVTGLDDAAAHRVQVVGHLRQVIAAAAKLGVGVVNTFVGRDRHKSIDDNWPVVRELWP